jgi:HK97 family phage major capsid protein
MNLKPYYDAAQAAEARVRECAAKIDELFQGGKTADATALRPELEQLKQASVDANQLYLSMRNTDQGGSDPMERVMQISQDDLKIGMSKKELANYSLIRAIRCASLAAKDPSAWSEAGLELEASRAVAQKLGRNPTGFYMPLDITVDPRYGRAMNANQVGDPSKGGYLVGTELLSGSFIDVLRNKMVTRAAGATVLTGLVGDVAIPKKTSGSTLYWIGESKSPTVSELGFGQVAARPRTGAGYLQLSRKLLKQSSLDVEMLARDDLASTIAVGVDLAGLHGAGSANEPLGVANVSGIGSVVGDTNGAAPDWADIVDLETEVATDNADLGSLAYISNAKVRGKLKKTMRTATYGDIPIWSGGAQPLNDYPVWVTNQVKSTLVKGNSGAVCSAIFFGNWADLVYCFWGGLDVIVDPYTNSTSGEVLVTAMQDVDVVVRRAVSFSAMLDALTS